jgi:hypothetical protein
MHVEPSLCSDILYLHTISEEISPYPSPSCSSSCPSPSQEPHWLRSTSPSSPSSCNRPSCHLDADFEGSCSNWECIPHAATTAPFDPFAADSAPAAAPAQSTVYAETLQTAPASRCDSSTSVSEAAGAAWQPAARRNEQAARNTAADTAPASAAEAAGSLCGWGWPATPAALPPNATRSVMLLPVDPFHDDFAFW